MHISKVLRNSAGDKIHITDGNGRKFTGIIEQINKNQVVVKSDELVTEERAWPYITLCIGLIKKRDRLEFAIEKATELGVDEIIVFRGEHSQKQNIRTDRLQAAALSAMKQSLRYYLPPVRMAQSLSEVLKGINRDVPVILADEIRQSENDFTEIKQEKLLLIVGPEGGFSEKERELLREISAVPYSLGKNRLRTETAAVLMTDRFKNRLFLKS